MQLENEEGGGTTAAAPASAKETTTPSAPAALVSATALTDMGPERNTGIAPGNDPLAFCTRGRKVQGTGQQRLICTLGSCVGCALVKDLLLLDEKLEVVHRLGDGGVHNDGGFLIAALVPRPVLVEH